MKDEFSQTAMAGAEKCVCGDEKSVISERAPVAVYLEKDQTKLMFDKLSAKQLISKAASKLPVHPLLLAASIGHEAGVKKLISAKGNINMECPNDRATALHLAAAAGHTDMLILLIEAGAKLDLVTKDGYNPLMVAVLSCQAEAVEEILRLKHLFNINACDKLGNTALHMAAKMNWCEAVRLLLNAGINKYQRNKMRRTALCVAMELENKGATTHLLEDLVITKTVKPFIETQLQLLKQLRCSNSTDDHLIENTLMPSLNLICNYEYARNYIHFSDVYKEIISVASKYLRKETTIYSLDEFIAFFLESMVEANSEGINEGKVQAFISSRGPEFLVKVHERLTDYGISETHLCLSPFVPMLLTHCGKSWISDHFSTLEGPMKALCSSLTDVIKSSEPNKQKGLLHSAGKSVLSQFKEAFVQMQVDQSNKHYKELLESEMAKQNQEEVKKAKKTKQKGKKVNPVCSEVLIGNTHAEVKDQTTGTTNTAKVQPVKEVIKMTNYEEASLGFAYTPERGEFSGRFEKVLSKRDKKKLKATGRLKSTGNLSEVTKIQASAAPSKDTVTEMNTVNKTKQKTQNIQTLKTMTKAGDLTVIPENTAVQNTVSNSADEPKQNHKKVLEKKFSVSQQENPSYLAVLKKDLTSLWEKRCDTKNTAGRKTLATKVEHVEHSIVDREVKHMHKIVQSQSHLTDTKGKQAHRICPRVSDNTKPEVSHLQKQSNNAANLLTGDSDKPVAEKDDFSVPGLEENKNHRSKQEQHSVVVCKEELADKNENNSSKYKRKNRAKGSKRLLELKPPNTVKFSSRNNLMDGKIKINKTLQEEIKSECGQSNVKFTEDKQLVEDSKLLPSEQIIDDKETKGKGGDIGDVTAVAGQISPQNPIMKNHPNFIAASIFAQHVKPRNSDKGMHLPEQATKTCVVKKKQNKLVKGNTEEVPVCKVDDQIEGKSSCNDEHTATEDTDSIEKTKTGLIASAREIGSVHDKDKNKSSKDPDQSNKVHDKDQNNRVSLQNIQQPVQNMNSDNNRPKSHPLPSIQEEVQDHGEKLNMASDKDGQSDAKSPGHRTTNHTSENCASFIPKYAKSEDLSRGLSDADTVKQKVQVLCDCFGLNDAKILSEFIDQGHCGLFSPDSVWPETKKTQLVEGIVSIPKGLKGMSSENSTFPSPVGGNSYPFEYIENMCPTKCWFENTDQENNCLLVGAESFSWLLYLQQQLASGDYENSWNNFKARGFQKKYPGKNYENVIRKHTGTAKEHGRECLEKLKKQDVTISGGGDSTIEETGAVKEGKHMPIVHEQKFKLRTKRQHDLRSHVSVSINGITTEKTCVATEVKTLSIFPEEKEEKNIPKRARSKVNISINGHVKGQTIVQKKAELGTKNNQKSQIRVPVKDPMKGGNNVLLESPKLKDTIEGDFAKKLLENLFEEIIARTEQANPLPSNDGELPLWSKWHNAVQELYRLLPPFAYHVRNLMIARYPEKFKIGTSFLGTLVCLGITSCGKTVAVKRVQRALLAGVNEQLAQLQMKNLSHPNILPLLFSVEDTTYHYTVTPVCECNLSTYLFSLSAYSHAHDPFITRRLSHQILHGLAYLHSHQITHGNLKPENVLLDCFGSVRLSDYGLQIKDNNTTLHEQTMVWKATEVIGNCTNPRTFEAWAAADMQVCGMLIYCCLTQGRHPYGEDLSSIKANICLGQPHLSPICPEADDLIQSLLMAEPVARPTASASLCHPFFWEMQCRQIFIQQVSMILCDKAHTKKSPPVLGQLRRTLAKIPSSMVVFQELPTAAKMALKELTGRELNQTSLLGLLNLTHRASQQGDTRQQQVLQEISRNLPLLPLEIFKVIRCLYPDVFLNINLCPTL